MYRVHFGRTEARKWEAGSLLLRRAYLCLCERRHSVPIEISMIPDIVRISRVLRAFGYAPFEPSGVPGI